MSTQERALFTFSSHSIARSTPSSAKTDDELEEEDEEDPHDVTLLHGSPSKKDFLDKIKQLKQKDNDEVSETISTDHDLQTYTSTPIVKELRKNIVNFPLNPFSK